MKNPIIHLKKPTYTNLTILGLAIFLTCVIPSARATITDIKINGSDSASINENSPSGTTIGTLSTTGDSSPYTYSLTSGTGDEDNGKFTITDNELKLNFTPDYENPTDLGDTPGN